MLHLQRSLLRLIWCYVWRAVYLACPNPFLLSWRWAQVYVATCILACDSSANGKPWWCRVSPNSFLHRNLHGSGHAQVFWRSPNQYSSVAQPDKRYRQTLVPGLWLACSRPWTRNVHWLEAGPHAACTTYPLLLLVLLWLLSACWRLCFSVQLTRHITGWAISVNIISTARNCWRVTLALNTTAT